jgi:hypothetical protein
MRSSSVSVGAAALALLGSALVACADAPPPVLHPATAARGFTVCWRLDDDGFTAQAKALQAALGRTLYAAGYKVVESPCDFRIEYSWTTEWRHPPGWFKQVRVVLRSGNGTFLDKFFLDFSPYEISVEESDRLATLITNGVTASPKLATARGAVTVVTPLPPP